MAVGPLDLYFDNAATTPLDPAVRAAMEPWLDPENCGNPSTVYTQGVEARVAIERARLAVMRAVGTDEDSAQVIFTSSGSESVNLAHKGVVWASGRRPAHVVSCVTEHSSSLNSLRWLEARGEAEVTWLPVRESGELDPTDLQRALRPDTALVSVMAVNSETGVRHPIAEVRAITRERGVPLHVDAVQGAGKIPIAFAETADLLSINAHKFHGPKGASSLVVRRDLPLEPLIHGGSQEGGLRGGTEVAALIVGHGEAITRAVSALGEWPERWRAWRAQILKGLAHTVEGVHLNGACGHSVANILNLGIDGLDGRRLVALAAERGIALSAGSACVAGGTARSHVLTAMGLSEPRVVGGLRISMGRFNTQAGVDHLITELPGLIAEARRQFDPANA